MKMPTIPSTVEIPIGRFIKYVLIFIGIGIIIGVTLGAIAFTTNWLHLLALSFWQFFIVENPVIPTVCVGVGVAYFMVLRKFSNKRKKPT